jgi:hypothetical protein
MPNYLQICWQVEEVAAEGVRYIGALRNFHRLQALFGGW